MDKQMAERPDINMPPVAEWTKDNTVSFGLRDMNRRFRDCLGR